MNKIVNIPLLRKSVEWVEEQAALPWVNREWYQDEWRRPGHFIINAQGQKKSCDTVMCIAGRIADWHGIEWNSNGYIAVDGRSVPEIASELLGIERSSGLFDVNNTAADVRRIAEELAGERL